MLAACHLRQIPQLWTGTGAGKPHLLSYTCSEENNVHAELKDGGIEEGVVNGMLPHSPCSFTTFNRLS